MATTPYEILAVADALVINGGEASLRSGVSRYFYAAYHRCGSWQASLPGMASQNGYAGGSHQQLLNMLRNPDGFCGAAQKQKSRFMATKLEALRNRRVTADYYLTAPMEAGEVQAQKIQATALLASCDTA
jgi:hypothetical protein